MKKIILTFGLVCGAVMSAMMVLTMPFIDRIGFDHGEVLGYTTMVVASLAIYFGVRRYRDEAGGGSVSFWRAFLVGAAIGGIACVCYTATWEVLYFNFMPDFADKYAAHTLAVARAHGASAAELAQTQAELARFKQMYANPLVNVAFTFVEPLPVTLLVALISAGLLRRRRPAEGSGAAELARVV
jgi:hypothetical protein